MQMYVYHGLEPWQPEHGGDVYCTLHGILMYYAYTMYALYVWVCIRIWTCCCGKFRVRFLPQQLSIANWYHSFVHPQEKDICLMCYWFSKLAFVKRVLEAKERRAMAVSLVVSWPGEGDELWWLCFVQKRRGGWVVMFSFFLLFLYTLYACC